MVEVLQPIYKEVYAQYKNPKQLREILFSHPLDKEAINWISDQGWHIEVDTPWYYEASSSPEKKRITLDRHSKIDADKLLVHELMHVIVPGIYVWNNNRWPYVEVLDEEQCHCQEIRNLWAICMKNSL